MGAVSFTLARSANSTVPSSADSAFVRVWRPNGSYNLKDIVNVPDPGQQTEVSLKVPSDSGYRAGILVTEPENGRLPNKKLLAHSSSDRFSLGAGDTARVNLDARVADLTLEAPSSIQANKKDTVKAIYGANPPDTNPRLSAERSQSSSFRYTTAADLSQLGSVETDTTVTQEFEINGPNVDSEDTTYVKIRVEPGPISDWVPGGREFRFDYFPSYENSSFSIPVVPGGSDGGTVIITFSRDEDGWKKTRRAVQ